MLVIEVINTLTLDWLVLVLLRTSSSSAPHVYKCVVFILGFQILGVKIARQLMTRKKEENLLRTYQFS